MSNALSALSSWSDAMAVEWFYGAKKAKLGPFTAKQLTELKVLGKLQPTDMVWKAGIQNGLPAGEIRGLFGSEPASAVALESSDMQIFETPLDDLVSLSVAATVPVAPQGQAQEIIPELLKFIIIPDGAEIAPPVAGALLASDKSEAPIVASLDPPPPKNHVPEHVPTDLAPPPSIQPRVKPAVVRMKRAIAESGAIILSQDGERVRFRKKCVRCGFEDACNSTMRIMPGINRQLFFCPKCRKQVGVAIRTV
jgi:hypothetical protein